MKRRKCTCTWGDAMYGGWIRTSTDSRCPQHGVSMPNPTKIERRPSAKDVGLCLASCTAAVLVGYALAVVLHPLAPAVIALGMLMAPYTYDAIIGWATAGMIDRSEAERIQAELPMLRMEARLRALDCCPASWEDGSHPLYKENLQADRELEALEAEKRHHEAPVEAAVTCMNFTTKEELACLKKDIAKQFKKGARPGAVITLPPGVSYYGLRDAHQEFVMGDVIEVGPGFRITMRDGGVRHTSGTCHVLVDQIADIQKDEHSKYWKDR
jgi:hypothetical protein